MVGGNTERILVVDDEDFIADVLATSLGYVGYDVATATDGRKALELVDTFDPALVLLDVNMPELDGFEVCRRLRAAGDERPVIFLTARHEPADRVSGFGTGGDDYVVKPFVLDEVVARVRAVLKRTHGSGATGELLSCGDLELDVETHRVRRGADEVDLSPREFSLLQYLLENQGRVVSKDQILATVWGHGFEGDTGLVETYISYLRKKVDDRADKLIHTIRGFGYSLRTSA